VGIVEAVEEPEAQNGNRRDHKALRECMQVRLVSHDKDEKKNVLEWRYSSIKWCAEATEESFTKCRIWP
jgi:hypothetical protein